MKKPFDANQWRSRKDIKDVEIEEIYEPLKFFIQFNSKVNKESSLLKQLGIELKLVKKYFQFLLKQTFEIS